MRANGAIEGGAAGFAVEDSVIFMKGLAKDGVHRVVGHINGIWPCLWCANDDTGVNRWEVMNPTKKMGEIIGAFNITPDNTSFFNPAQFYGVPYQSLPGASMVADTDCEINGIKHTGKGMRLIWPAGTYPAVWPTGYMSQYGFGMGTLLPTVKPENSNLYVPNDTKLFIQVDFSYDISGHTPIDLDDSGLEIDIVPYVLQFPWYPLFNTVQIHSTTTEPVGLNKHFCTLVDDYRGGYGGSGSPLGTSSRSGVHNHIEVSMEHGGNFNIPGPRPPIVITKDIWVAIHSVTYVKIKAA